ncbi:transposase domain-containing protein [Amedibacillus sp. YH-ame6]
MSQEELIDLLINRDGLANENSKLEQENNWYREQIAMLKKARFSSSSEQTIAGQLNLFNEVEDVNDHPVEEIAEPVKKSKKKKQREADFSKLPTRIIEPG